jgi:hypothetical protein
MVGTRSRAASYQYAPEQLVGVLGDRLDEADRVDPVIPPRAGAE